MTNNDSYRNFSVAKSILATLWRVKAGSLAMFVRSPYARILAGDKSLATFLSSLSRLKQGGLIQLKTKNIFFLTSLGQHEALLAFIAAETLLYRRPNGDWDGGWRFVFFDIPEEKRRYRDYLRDTLRTVGFKEFQKSVWVYPFPVPSFLKDLLLQEDIRPHVKFISAGAIDDDQELKRLFLPERAAVHKA